MTQEVKSKLYDALDYFQYVVSRKVPKPRGLVFFLALSLNLLVAIGVSCELKQDVNLGCRKLAPHKIGCHAISLCPNDEYKIIFIVHIYNIFLLYIYLSWHLGVPIIGVSLKKGGAKIDVEEGDIKNKFFFLIIWQSCSQSISNWGCQEKCQRHVA